MQWAALLRFVVDRLKERSTWLGIAAVLTAAGVGLSPEQGVAITTAGVALAGLLSAFWPDTKPPVPPVAPIILFCLLPMLGCVTYDGAAYQRASGVGATAIEVTDLQCVAHEEGAQALGSGAGDSWALKAPLGSGWAIEEFEAIHDRQSRVCWRALELKEEGGLASEAESRMVHAWKRTWISGSAVVRGE